MYSIALKVPSSSVGKSLMELFCRVRVNALRCWPEIINDFCTILPPIQLRGKQAEVDAELLWYESYPRAKIRTVERPEIVRLLRTCNAVRFKKGRLREHFLSCCYKFYFAANNCH